MAQRMLPQRAGGVEQRTARPRPRWTGSHAPEADRAAAPANIEMAPDRAGRIRRK
jgi:hypothetical protein